LEKEYDGLSAFDPALSAHARGIKADDEDESAASSPTLGKNGMSFAENVL